MSRSKLLTCTCLVLAAAGCAGGPTVSTTQAVTAGDAPYDHILVIALFESFDARRWLEQEVVNELTEAGVQATPMTSMSDTRTIINRDTVLDRVTRTGADAVLVTQLVTFESTGKSRDARPEATYNVWPTYWYNVFEVQLTEYVEPPLMEWTNELKLSSMVYSAASQDRVWSINSDWKIKERLETGSTRDYSVIVEEAESIVRAAKRAGVIE
ncbi:MAG TPA: hypothetical protein VFY03_14210 [Woeseiaceae bacterium]|nr:hypothetical protein [Woeseiaceae bacterium]